MPNWITNRLTLSGDQKQIDKLVEKYSTFYEKTPKLAYDGTTCYINKENVEYGWYDKNKNEFKRRNKDSLNYIPEGFEISYESEWTRFPDFNKIIPQPESLNIESGSTGELAHFLLFGDHEKQERKSIYSYMSISECRKRFSEMSIEYQNEGVKLAIQYQDNLNKYRCSTWYEWNIKNWGTKWNCCECHKSETKDNVYSFQTAWYGVPLLIHKISEEFPDINILYEYSDEDTGYNCGRITFFNNEIEDKEIENQSNEAYEIAFDLKPDVKEYYYLDLDSKTYKHRDECCEEVEEE